MSHNAIHGITTVSSSVAPDPTGANLVSLHQQPSWWPWLVGIHSSKTKGLLRHIIFIRQWWRYIGSLCLCYEDILSNLLAPWQWMGVFTCPHVQLTAVPTNSRECPLSPAEWYRYLWKIVTCMGNSRELVRTIHCLSSRKWGSIF